MTSDDYQERLDTARQLLDQGDADQAILNLLAAAQQRPLDDCLHTLLARALPDLPAPDHKPYMPWTLDYSGLRSGYVGAGKSLRFLLNVLDERLVFDEELLVIPSFPAPHIQERWVRVGLSDELAPHIPFHELRSGVAYSWSGPKVSFEENQRLTVCQESTYRHRWDEVGYEQRTFVAYRVRGPLFHARFVRANWWQTK